MTKVYIASPFFNPRQVKDVEFIKKELSELGLDYYSPKDESNISNGFTPQKALEMNVTMIDQCDFMIANVDYANVGFLNKKGIPENNSTDMIPVRVSDIGTSIEMGIAWAKSIPVLLWSAKPPTKQNLMETMFYGFVCGEDLKKGVVKLIEGEEISQAKTTLE